MKFVNKEVHFVAGLHGNEKGPIRALKESDESFIIGNPLECDKNTRFIDRDLNASFGTLGNTYEEKRANELLNQISVNDKVIDFHTTSAHTPSFAIVTDIKMFSFAERSGLGYAVLMTHNIKKGGTLINHRDGVAIEIEGYDTPHSLSETLKVMSHFKSGKFHTLKNMKCTISSLSQVTTKTSSCMNMVLFQF